MVRRPASLLASVLASLFASCFVSWLVVSVLGGPSSWLVITCSLARSPALARSESWPANLLARCKAYFFMMLSTTAEGTMNITMTPKTVRILQAVR